MVFLTLAILAGIGALIGWVTNLLAVKLLFRPFEPVRIPIINVSIQGLIPKRRSEIARSIGKTVEEELLSVDEILYRLMETQDKKEILQILKIKIQAIVEERLPSLIPSAFRGMIGKYIEDVIEREGETMLAEVMASVVKKATENINIGQMVEEKVNDFELEGLESMVLTIAQKELKHIEILGGVLGFMIGLFQGIIILLL
ncbi:conserved hypothetical protein [Alkaliphilus metalliredigens QYMF]|uniref:Uncharacterized protein n=1 Tax=Alkaliphilus metalliredigens (strain QYMF) TaxID=293826 RepID=A6TNN9_ALKMQ|nr:DUF445 family protein [Alkaliphilus metalliredigens]ABR47807.1 conserved hypothetical protein [Alkaliphilus metalliredigens QYMF]